MIANPIPYAGEIVEWVTTSTLLDRLGGLDDRETWEQFARRFRLPIVQFVRGMGLRPADAEDVAQESLLAFTQGFRRGQYDRAKGRLSKWLFGIAYRQAMNARREIARREAKHGTPGKDSSFWRDIPDEQAASATWDQSWEQSLLEQCLELIRREVEPLTYRAFELTVREQRSPAAAARELGVSVKLVYNAKHRLLKRIRELREELDQVG